MTQRTAALNLEWAQWSNVEWGANLPPIPGYPGTRYDGNVYAVVGPSVVNGEADGFRLHISISYDDNIVLDNRDFDISDGTADEMMAAVDNLSLRDIADMLDDMGYGPIDNSTASRHASKRTASMDVDWWKTSADTWAADLPAIPGYPKPGGGHYHVGLYDIVNDDHEIIGYGFSLNIVGPTGAVTLWNDDFGFGYADTEEDAMQEVESLSPEEIAQAAADKGVTSWDGVTASRKGNKMIRKATRRTASMDLDWVNPSEDVYQADLPAIPGYTEPDGNESFVTVTYDNDGGVEAVATIFPTQGGVVNLDCWSILGFIPQDETLEDVMQAFDDLDVYDFSYALDDMGIEPMVDENGEYVVASRKVTQRKAHFDLEWEKEEDGSYFAPLPYSYDAYVYDAATVRGSSQTGWRFQITDGYYILDDTDFGIPAASTAEEAMSEVENLTFEDIDKKMAELFPEQ